jgi:hypothetical protein
VSSAAGWKAPNPERAAQKSRDELFERCEICALYGVNESVDESLLLGGG